MAPVRQHSAELSLQRSCDVEQIVTRGQNAATVIAAVDFYQRTEICRVSGDVSRGGSVISDDGEIYASFDERGCPSQFLRGDPDGERVLNVN